MVWRDEECAYLGTRRLMALARKTGRPAHILHVSTAQGIDYLKDYRDIVTCEGAVNDGMVDTIGSDHAPHAREAKLRPWPTCASGLTGVQTLVPIMLDHVHA